MKKLTTHSRSSLFLLELLFSLLFLALACAACVQVFAAAYTNRTQARCLNHVQELTITAGELLEGWDGDSETLSRLLQEIFGEAEIENNRLTAYYEKGWNPCSIENAAYMMVLDFRVTAFQKEGTVNFSRISGESLYQQDIRYPFFGKENGNE